MKLSSVGVFFILLSFTQPGFADEKNPLAIPDVGIVSKVEQIVPLDLKFKNADGQDVQLGQYFGDKPVIIAPVYYECPMLCTLVLNGLVQSVKDLAFTVGDEFEIVTFSFNPRETPDLARKKKVGNIESYGRSDAGKGWHFLSGDEESISRLTDALGFRYEYNETTKEYAHASSIMVLTPEGKISSYFKGIDYPARDLRLALVDASQGKIGSLIDRVALLCFHYDPVTGKYGLQIMSILRLAGLVTVLVIGGYVLSGFIRGGRRRGVKPA